MNLYWGIFVLLMVCIYIALTVKNILENQNKLNNARYEQIKKLQEEVEKLRSEIISIKKDNF